jgi:hypothetical protein
VGALPQGHLAQPIGVGAVGRPYHQHYGALGGKLPDRILAILGCITDVVLPWSENRGKPPPQRLDNASGVIDGQGRLGDVRQVLRIADLKSLDISDRLDELNTLADLPERAFHFRVTRVADQNALRPVPVVPDDFGMDLGHQRAGGIENLQVAALGLGPYRQRDTVGAENNRGTIRDIRKILYKDRTFSAQILHDKPVMHHFVPDVDRGAKTRQREFDDVDGAIDTGTETAWIG